MELSNLLLLQVTFCLAYLTTGTALGQFSFIPSPNITILQSAVYRCSVDEGNSLTWTVNGASSATSGWQPYIDSVGITHDSTGANNGVLTMPGNNITLNGSTVECAYGIINGIVYGDSDSSTLYIQGPPSMIGISCQFQLPSFINCSWSTPFTLPGINITHYFVNITDSNGPVVLENITDTQYGYIIEHPGLYTISVTPYINDLEGETDSTQLTLNISFTSNISLYHDNQDQLMMNVILGLETYPDEAILSMKSVSRSGNYSIDWNYGSLPVSGVVNVTDMSRIKNVSVDIMVKYSGLSLNSNKTHFIDTFDVIDVTNETLNSTDNMVFVCFECIFNPTMLNPHGCNVTYTSTNDTAHGSVWSTTQCSCSNILHEYIYDIMVYDIKKNGISYDKEPAIQLQDVSFHPNYTGTTPTTAISVMISTTTSSITSSTGTTSSNTPTLPTSILPTRSTSTSTAIVVIIISGAVIAILILITFLVLLLIAIIKKRFSTHQNNRFKAITLQQDVPLQTNPCYQTVQVPNNRNGYSKSDTVYENIRH